MRVMADPRCGTCGGAMVRKNRSRLLLVGLLMLASPAVAVFVPYLWGPAIVLVMTGLYLIIWATLGRGYWCRECKKFSLLTRGRAGAAAASVSHRTSG